MAKSISPTQMRALSIMHATDKALGHPSCYGLMGPGSYLGSVGANRATMRTLEARGLVEYNKAQWRLTDAGRAALGE